jgi:Mg2+/Co2+ transporter CorC
MENWICSMHQMVDFITDMANKSRTVYSGKGKDLRVLAEGAEEMRILGSILSINKGLKATFADAESFIDTIENLIYDRKKVLGKKPSEDDKIDFHKFMVDEEYQAEVINKYEKVKHSVNIPHLITKAPHF